MLLVFELNNISDSFWREKSKFRDWSYKSSPFCFDLCNSRNIIISQIKLKNPGYGPLKWSRLSSATKTRSLTLGWRPVCFHFETFCSWFRYSRVQPFQNCCVIFLTRWYRLSLEMFDCLESSVMLFGQVPMRKCPGVRGFKSLGSELIRDSGREFNIPSICITSVRNSS